MKKVLITVALLTFVGLANAGVSWEGKTWEPNPTATSLSIIDGDLHVTSGGIGWAEFDDYGVNHYEVCFDLDLGTEPVIQTSDYSGANTAQIIVDVAAWTLLYDEYDDGGTSAINFIPVALPGSAPVGGAHMLTYDVGVDGYLDISFDGSPLWNASTVPGGDLKIDSIFELRLGAGSMQQGGTGVYTSCVPEPATMALLALGGLLIRKRK